jgi:NADH-quinone oxidoreductase subunit C
MTNPPSKPNLDHPTLPLLKAAMPKVKLLATEFRGQTTVVVPKDDVHTALAFLKHDKDCRYNFLSDIIGVDYLNYPSSKNAPKGRFGVIYNLCSTIFERRLFIKVLLDPSIDTSGTEHDPALHLRTATDIWSGAEWPEREVYDMFGIYFDGHPDHRRILTWESYPAHPLRKDYPLRGRGERESYRVVDRDSA